ncbi:hypothetical protein SAMN05216215_1021127 [Saccharopolyspora shandongensis]|uniref:Uncharacterized protein n=1 Tax=Saccharopolyspora shandongensis TaxID=418495 RepID=A0A1H3HWN9_9PSEU|nr:hypothetical protein SAMN05216215_1021127 [Saccharopolyspora shandongensis]
MASPAEHWAWAGQNASSNPWTRVMPNATAAPAQTRNGRRH